MDYIGVLKQFAVNGVSANVDYLYGPFESIETACSKVPQSIRSAGRTVGILTSSGVVEYWWKNGVTDSDLVEKSQSDGGGNLADNLENFIEVIPTSEGNIVIDNKNIPFSKVTLSGDSRIFNLSISNTKEGSFGKILVFQTGLKQIAVAENIKGTVDLPLNNGTIALLSYNRSGNNIYIYTDVVLGDTPYPNPQRIADFQAVYYDNTVCIVQWTAPYANNIYDPATEYDMRYSNSPVNADDPTVWAGLSSLKNLPVPAAYQTEQKYSISGLQAGNEYYIYLKAVRVNQGVRYISKASSPVYFKTINDTTDAGDKYYRLELTPEMLCPRRDAVSMSGGKPCAPANTLDETEKDLFLENGYPDRDNKSYSTYFKTESKGVDNPYSLVIDLNASCVLDKLYLYAVGASTGEFRVLISNDINDTPEYVVTSTNLHNGCAIVDLQKKSARLLYLRYDLDPFAATQTGVDGEEIWPLYNQGNLIGQIYRLMIYGRRNSDIPLNILPPVRSVLPRKPVDDFFNVVGWFYQPGRMFSLCSGPHVRLFGSSGQFLPNMSENPVSRIADVAIRPNQIGWVNQNNGMDYNLIQLLKETYKKYGLKPFTASSSWATILRYQANSSNVNKPLDGYWLPGAWEPLPSKGRLGYEKYFEVSMNPNSYKTISKMYSQLMAVYGKSAFGQNDIKIYPADDTEVSTNMDLMCGAEIGNEDDRTWSGWMAFTQPEEMGALLSAVYDGHCGTLTDEDGNTKYYGIKQASPDSLVIVPGFAGIVSGYIKELHLWCKQNRPDGKLPFDILNFHTYFSDKWEYDWPGGACKAVTLESILASNKNDIADGLPRVLDIRNRYMPDKELWITEFGYGEAGGENTNSQYQCYSQPGRRIGSWLIPDRHRSEVRASWSIRAALTLMRLGIDSVNYYAIDQMDYWSSCGYEMWHWNDEASDEPGAKCEAIKKHMKNIDATGFTAFGLFGSFLTNGCYPICNTFWWVATFRNRLKGYIYTGQKYLDTDSRIIVMCFRKLNEEKGAYIIYLNDSVNTGVPNVRIPLPERLSQVVKVTTYVPAIPNPESMPSTFEFDQQRTGLPTTRKEKYINGEWVIQNKKLAGTYESFAQGDATYPANPQEGDEVYVLPTAEENPYFPIVGPVGCQVSRHLQKPSSKEYEWIDPSDPTLPNGEDKWAMRYNPYLSYRQEEAVCDYIEYTEEGQHGTTGDETIINTDGAGFVENITEYPAYYFFDAIPEPDFKGKVTDVAAIAVNSSVIKLFWNNHNAEDTSYDIFVSSLPETGYSLMKNVPAGISNSAEIAGLSANTTYYFKVRPVKGSMAGELSDFASAHTISFMPVPDNVRMASRTSLSIALTWDYTPDSNFVMYAVYRSSGGPFELVGKIEDKNMKSFTDTGLKPGTAYSYKLKAFGQTGYSEYTEEYTVSTLTAEQDSPLLQSAYTDKLGTQVILTFNLPMSAFAATLKSQFTLTEEGNACMITSASLDSSDMTRIILTINEGSLSNYDKNRNVRIGYTSIENGITSSYGVKLESFNNYRVRVNVGNFTNLAAMYKINFTSANSETPVSDSWNNFVAVNNENGYITPASMKLHDTYGIASDVAVEIIQDNSTHRWSGIGKVDVACTLADVEKCVAESIWETFRSSLVTENITARLRISGLNPERRYTFRAFSSVRYGYEFEDDVRSKMKINGVYSNIVNQYNNADNFAVIEDALPDASGELYVDFIPMREVVGRAVNYSFMYIEEYVGGSDPSTDQVVLRGVTVNEADDTNSVTESNVTMYLNCVGPATHYRTSESDLSSENFVEIPDTTTMMVPYTLSDGYGEKTLNVQVKNSKYESNIRQIILTYKDSYIPITLKNIYVNDNADQTDSREVSVFIEKLGIPTHYRIGEVADLSGVEWVVWTEGTTVSYTLSEGNGQKTVYAQIKDANVESVIKSDTITFSSLALKSISINDGATSTSNPELTVTLDYDGVPTHYRAGEIADLSGVEWLALSGNSIPYTLTDTALGEKTIYVQVKSAKAESVVISDTITFIEAILPRIVVSFSADRGNPYPTDVNYPTYQGEIINHISGSTSTASWADTPIKDTLGNEVGVYSVRQSDIPSNENTYIKNYITQAITAAVGESSPYPIDYIKYYLCPRVNGSETQRFLVRFKNIATGTYTIRVLVASYGSYEVAANKQANCFYVANGVSVNLSFDPATNVDQFIVIENVAVTDDGILDLEIYNTAGISNKPGLNLIEIAKER